MFLGMLDLNCLFLLRVALIKSMAICQWTLSPDRGIDVYLGLIVLGLLVPKREGIFRVLPSLNLTLVNLLCLDNNLSSSLMFPIFD